MWSLVYASTVLSMWTNFGLMTEGPFETEQACFQYIEAQLKQSDGWIVEPEEKTRRNFYSSRSEVRYRNHAKSGIGTYYSCVKMRSP